MAHDIKMAKLVSGEVVVGKFNDETKTIEAVALMQSVPTKEGVQMMMLPYGYPFEQSFEANISFDHILYAYKASPEELKTKYLEITTNLTLQKSNIIT